MPSISSDPRNVFMSRSKGAGARRYVASKNALDFGPLLLGKVWWHGREAAAVMPTLLAS